MTEQQTKHFRELNQRRKHLLPILEANAADLSKDRKGSSTSVYSDSLRFIGISDFLLNHDIESFQRMLSKSAKLRGGLFARFAEGEPVDRSYVSVLAYRKMLDALAARDLETATEIARAIGTRPDIDEEHALPLDIALGYALKAAVLARDQKSANEVLGNLLKANEHVNFLGYGTVLRQLEYAELNVSAEVFRIIVEGHKREAAHGVFKGFEDEHLCVWGVGLANLVLARGGHIVGTLDELIPRALLNEERRPS